MTGVESPESGPLTDHGDFSLSNSTRQQHFNLKFKHILTNHHRAFSSHQSPFCPQLTSPVTTLCIQLFDLQNIKHGLFLMPKSSHINTSPPRAHAFSLLFAQVSDLEPFRPRLQPASKYLKFNRSWAQ